MKYLEGFGVDLMHIGLIAFLLVVGAATSDRYFGTAYKQGNPQTVTTTK